MIKISGRLWGCILYNFLLLLFVCRLFFSWLCDVGPYFRLKVIQNRLILSYLKLRQNVSHMILEDTWSEKKYSVTCSFFNQLTGRFELVTSNVLSSQSITCAFVYKCDQLSYNRFISEVLILVPMKCFFVRNGNKIYVILISLGNSKCKYSLYLKRTALAAEIYN